MIEVMQFVPVARGWDVLLHNCVSKAHIMHARLARKYNKHNGAAVWYASQCAMPLLGNKRASAITAEGHSLSPSSISSAS